MEVRRIERPTEPVDATIHVPGSKSIANRALVCAALAEGTSTLDNMPDGDDTQAMLRCLRELGLDAELAGDRATITGAGPSWPPGERTLFAGLAVLWAAVQSSLDERSFESAILRTLGASRKRVLSGVVIEFVAIGLLAGLLASSGASLAAWHLAVNVYELEYHFSPSLWLAGPVLGMLFVGASGLAATWRVVTHSPVSVLRAT